MAKGKTAEEGLAVLDEGLVEAILAAYPVGEGELLVPHQGNAVDVLVATILSQASNDIQAREAFQALKRRFSSWEEVCAADAESVEEAIRGAGLGREKARSIQATLKKIRDDMGEIALKKLAGTRAEAAMKYLVSLPGVGPKTAACTMLFGLGIPVFPVDTHILRISRRLGLVPPRCSAEAAQRILDRQVPEDRKMAFHLGLIRHGRKVCRKNRPRCTECVVSRWCKRPGI